jgi:hypothetical protein
MFHQVFAVIRSALSEVIGSWPLRFAFQLVLAIEQFAHLEGLSFAAKPAWRLARPGSGVAFDSNSREFHPAGTSASAALPRSNTRGWGT